jgi:5-deoxy-D-glucuronate isomerase
VQYPSPPIPSSRTGTTVEVTRARAGWRYVHFAVRQVVPGKPWVHNTGAAECCLVLLAGCCRVTYTSGKGPAVTVTLGPRRSVFADYRAGGHEAIDGRQ